MKKPFFYCALISLLVIALACSKNNEDDLKKAPCDTSGVTYSGKIRPLFQQHCVSCHSSGKINMADYNSVKTLAFKGDLMEVLNYNGPKKMPPSGKLPDCDIAYVKAWIDKGAPND
jgi:mono/diheme cytochrome c family protein